MNDDSPEPDPLTETLPCQNQNCTNRIGLVDFYGRAKRHCLRCEIIHDFNAHQYLNEIMDPQAREGS